MPKSIKNIIYHILILVLSAAIAMSLPYTGRFIADNYQTYWSLVEGHKIFLLSVEVAVAVLLIFLFNFLGRSLRDRKFSRMATADLGLVIVSPAESIAAKKRVKRLKEQHGVARDMLLIGSTGFTTFVKPDGDLHRVIQNCREAKIMLLNPSGDGASIRAKSIADPDFTLESVQEQIVKSVEFLKGLKSSQKNIRLKLYGENPFLKLAVLGDYVFMKCYHSALNGRDVPENVFRHSAKHGSLFHLFYEYFLSKWRDPNIPEYDFDADELVYRDISGNELKREKFAREPNLLTSLRF